MEPQRHATPATALASLAALFRSREERDAAARLLDSGWRPLPGPDTWLPRDSGWASIAFACPTCGRLQADLDPLRVAPGPGFGEWSAQECQTRGCPGRLAGTLVDSEQGWTLLVSGVPRDCVFWCPTQVRSLLRVPS